MNPMDQHNEFVPLQGYEGVHGQPAGPPGGAQYTTVNISEEPPKDHILWSILCFAYSNPFCLGLAALVFSIKSRDRKVVGDFSGARHYGATARCLNIISTVIFSILLILSITTIILMIVRASQLSQMYSHRIPAWSG